MRKYYYYYWRSQYNFGCGIAKSDDTDFKVADETVELRKVVDGSATILFWHEISADEYEKMSELIGEEK